MTMSEQRNEFPKECPLDGEPPNPVKCAPCGYMKQIKWAGINYCKADRIEKGLPDYK